ncbi:MAG: 2,3-bisphosphoglycerate-independent phosphoglycerate mutase [Magnetococcales bacterium]|nr:2,3-bisphosphoglycerate-independent phosphoglycerate mutase [Magnetococcales bacterium]NGZ05760.1 2,3-bisphosphoglycerate-independent phosphoglycerate mutase [Magnetococcales bacterium]
MRPKPLMLIVLDGWGMRADPRDNAIVQAATPHFDQWWASRPRALLTTCGEEVGLPDGQMGNSEVGHANLGAGRILYQDFTRVERAVRTGQLAGNPALVRTVQRARAAGGTVHVLGLLSPGGVHSHQNHLLGAVRAARDLGVARIAVHAFLDGRDTPPRSALEYLAEFEAGLKDLGAGRIATVCGRYWAMDRDKRWERVERAHAMLVAGRGGQAASAAQAVLEAYARGEDDEFVQPCVIPDGSGAIDRVCDRDAILMMNFRADRAREIAHALLDVDFPHFVRSGRPALSGYLCLTEHDPTLPGVEVAFPPTIPTMTLGEVVAAGGLRQLRAAETEKYAHVTYFFNGGQEVSFPGEERLLIPSPKVATYDLQPEMSAAELTRQVVERVHAGKYDLMVVNYANPDMVGHTGRFEAAVQAIETVDRCLGEVAAAVLQQGGELLITADHGNADCMVDESGGPHTAHTLNPAPLIHVGRRHLTLTDGRLCDVAPTVLALMGLPVPPEMEGRSLIAGPITTEDPAS